MGRPGLQARAPGGPRGSQPAGPARVVQPQAGGGVQCALCRPALLHHRGQPLPQVRRMRVGPRGCCMVSCSQVRGNHLAATHHFLLTRMHICAHPQAAGCACGPAGAAGPALARHLWPHPARRPDPAPWGCGGLGGLHGLRIPCAWGQDCGGASRDAAHGERFGLCWGFGLCSTWRFAQPVSMLLGLH